MVGQPNKRKCKPQNHKQNEWKLANALMLVYRDSDSDSASESESEI